MDVAAVMVGTALVAACCRRGRSKNARNNTCYDAARLAHSTTARC
jgi:hypothetical protein